MSDEPKKIKVKIEGRIIEDFAENFVIDQATGEQGHKSLLIKYAKSLDLKNNVITDYVYSSIKPSTLVPALFNHFNSQVTFFNREYAEQSGFRESYKLGCFVPGHVKEAELEHKPYTTFSNYTENLDMRNPKLAIRYGEKSPTFVLTEGNRYTWGVEVETALGHLPSYVYNGLNICCKRDGSITGGEIISGVLTGDAGLIHLNKIMKQLALRCKIDNKCSVHVHVGGLHFSTQFLVAMYKLSQLIEEELFSIVPPSRQSNTYAQKIRKFNFKNEHNYPMDVFINEMYQEIFTWISMGKNPSAENNKNTNHPQGHTCHYQHDSPRYAWCNMVPAMFNTRGIGDKSKTIEIRLHSATLNYEKIKNWILICLGIIKYAENNAMHILNNKTNSISLSTIIKYAYPKKQQELIKYIDNRALLFDPKRAVLSTAKKNENDEYLKSNNITKEYKTIKELILD